MPDGEAEWTRPWPRSFLLLIGAGGLLGATGVALAAAGSHDGAGPLATTAGQFCVMHGGTIIALAVVAQTDKGRPFAWAAVLLAVGTMTFAADLAAVAFAEWRPLPMAAPVGGLMMIGGWLLVVLAAAKACLGRR